MQSLPEQKNLNKLDLLLLLLSMHRRRWGFRRPCWNRIGDNKEVTRWRRFVQHLLLQQQPLLLQHLQLAQ